MLKSSSSVQTLSIGFSKNSKSGETLLKQKWMLLQEKIWFILATYCILKDHTFRNKGPAIVGMRVLGGRVHIGQKIMKLDGTPIGQIKSLRTRSSEDVKQGHQGEELAVAVMGPTVGRQIEEGDEFWVDIPSSHAKRLRKLDLTPIEEEILEEITRLHRKQDHFWGR